MTEQQRFILTIFLSGCFLAVIFWFFKYVSPQLVTSIFGSKEHRSLLEWETVIEERLQEHTRLIIKAAAVEAELASMIKEMPKEFIHPIQRGIRFGYAYDIALRRKAFELGILNANEANLTDEAV